MTRGRRGLAAAMVASLLVGLSGCGEQMPDDEMFQNAREVNLAFKAAISTVQLQVLDGEWEIEALAYGDAPEKCIGGDGYSFSMRRGTPPEWKLDESARDTADRLAAWLDENGWENITTQGYSGDIANIVIQAKKPDAHVDRLMIDISPDPDTYDIATITAESSCQPGDRHHMFTLVYLDHDSDAGPVETFPKLENPRDDPSFGFTVDGMRRWDGTDGE